MNNIFIIEFIMSFIEAFICYKFLNLSYRCREGNYISQTICVYSFLIAFFIILNSKIIPVSALLLISVIAIISASAVLLYSCTYIQALAEASTYYMFIFIWEVFLMLLVEFLFDEQDMVSKINLKNGMERVIFVIFMKLCLCTIIIITVFFNEYLKITEKQKIIEIKNSITIEKFKIILKKHLQDQKVETAIQYLESLDSYGAGTADSSDIWSGEKTIDYILNTKKNLAKNLGIKMSIKTKVYLNIVESYDICAILSNLLDNAIEACSSNKVTDKIIEVSIKSINAMLIINVKNKFAEAPALVNGKLITKKVDTSYHGIGLDSVKTAAEKYEGALKISYEKGWFNANVTLFCVN